MRKEPSEPRDMLDIRATIVVCVSALLLSVLRLQGRDLEILTMRSEAWPQEPWRLLTCTLLHGGWFHLLFNVYWIYQLGGLVETNLGMGRTIGLYVLAAALSSAAQWGFSNAGIGLSGIVYGIFGFLWILHRYQPNYRQVLDDRIIKLFVAWFFIAIVITELGLMNIANVAHGVGAVAGLLVGMSMVPTPFGVWRSRAVLASTTLFLGLAATVGRQYVNYSDTRVFELNDAAIIALQSEENEAALEHLKQVLRIDDENITAWHNLGVAYHRLGNDEVAAAAMLRAKELEAAAEAARVKAASERGPFKF